MTTQITNPNYKHSELTGRIIKCSMSVHNYLGCGFPEVIYQRALAYELSLEGLSFAREVEMEVFYKDMPKPIGLRRVDFLVEKKILVEIKAVTNLEDFHLAQIINYVEAFKMDVGLLINFGSKRLQFRRAMLSETNELN